MPVRLDQSKRIELAAAAGALALFAGVVALTFSADQYSRQADAVLEDAGASRTEGPTRVQDLLSPPVEPGATVVTGVHVPPGWRVTDISPGGPFAVLSQTHTDHDDRTWYEVTARNDGPVVSRFVAWVEFAAPAADGGVQ